MKDLENFFLECKKISKKSSKPFYFLLAFTTKIEKYNYFITPFRQFNDFNLAGAVIFKDFELKKIISLAKKYSDKIILDIERKTQNSEEIYNKAIKLIKNSKKVFFIKTNDVTLDSVFNYILHFFHEKIFYRKKSKILLIGMGNIGSKLSLKLLESNFDIFIKGRNKKKINSILQSIKKINFKFNKNHIKLYSSKYAKDISGIISFIPFDNNLINLELLKKLSFCKVVIDVGKSGFDYRLIEYFKNKKIKYFRLDPEAGFQSTISSYLHFKDKFLKKIGRRKLKNKVLVSGGTMGEYSDLVTDNINSPKFIYGEINQQNDFSKRYIKKFSD